MESMPDNKTKANQSADLRSSIGTAAIAIALLTPCGTDATSPCTNKRCCSVVTCPNAPSMQLYLYTSSSEILRDEQTFQQ